MINILFVFSDVHDRLLMSGRYIVRDVSCRNCDTKLGWTYEFSTEENERYKEGKIMLERALITKGDGLKGEI